MTAPAWIAELRRQLGRPGVRGAVENVTWLAGERIAQLAVGMIVGVWAARALGPTRFGIFNYAFAFAGLFAGLATLGMDGVVVRELVRHPDRREVTLGTAFRLRAAGSIAVVTVLAAVAIAAYRGEPLTLALLLIFGASTLLKPFEVVDLWFQANTRLAPVVRARTIAFLAANAVRAGILLVLGGSVVALALVEPLMAITTSALFAMALRRDAPGLGWGRWSGASAEGILRDSWPLLVASMGGAVYMRIDQIMLENLGGAGGTHELGLYSAALRLSETWHMIPTVIVTAVFPHIVQSRREGVPIYEERLTNLFSLMTAIALGLAVPLTLVARPLVTLLFGASYAGAAPILALHIWTTLFVFWSVVGGAWTVTEGLTRISTVRSLQGAALNVALNYWLIPRYGGVGAAVATLASQISAVTLLNLTDARTRPLVRMQLRSLRITRLLSSKAGGPART